MGEARRSQMDGLIKKQKRIIRLAKTEQEKDEALVLWAGFLTGVRMSGAITKGEYEQMYSEMRNFQRIMQEG